MGSGAKKQIDTAGSITNTQLGIASEQSRREAESYQQMKDLLAPFISQQSALAGGDRNKALEAAMPVISQLTGGFNGAKQQIMNSMPPGPARDRALADLSTQMYTSIGGAQAGMVQQAPQSLAGIGQYMGGYGLQQLGSALAGLQGGAQTNESAMKAAVAQRQGLLNFFGGLAGAATSLFSPMKLFGGGSGNAQTGAGQASGGTGSWLNSSSMSDYKW